MCLHPASTARWILPKDALVNAKYPFVIAQYMLLQKLPGWNKASHFRSLKKKLCREMNVMTNMNFTLSSNDKNKLREFYDDVNEELITDTNISENYASELNSKITKQESQSKNYKVDYLSSAIIPSKAVGRNQEHLAAIRYGNTPLVS